MVARVFEKQLAIPMLLSACYIWYQIWYHSPNSLYCRGSGGVSSVLGICATPISAPYARNILCVGAVDGDGHVAPIYAKVLARITFVETHI